MEYLQFVLWCVVMMAGYGASIICFMDGVLWFAMGVPINKRVNYPAQAIMWTSLLIVWIWG